MPENTGRGARAEAHRPAQSGPRLPGRGPGAAGAVGMAGPSVKVLCSAIL